MTPLEEAEGKVLLLLGQKEALQGQSLPLKESLFPHCEGHASLHHRAEEILQGYVETEQVGHGSTRCESREDTVSQLRHFLQKGRCL